jgi:hypothetical protein
MTDINSKAINLLNVLDSYKNTDNINKITNYIERFRKDNDAIAICITILTNSSNGSNSSINNVYGSNLLILQTLTWLLRRINASSSIYNNDSIIYIIDNLISILTSSSPLSSYRPIETQIILSLGACIIKLLALSSSSSSSSLSLSSIILSKLQVLQLRQVVLILSILPETILNGPSSTIG